VSTTIGYYYTADVRGWWLFILFFQGAVNLAYTVAFLGLAKLARYFTTRLALSHAAAILIAQQIHVLLFYNLPPDWEAVNEGNTVFLSLQSFIHSDYSFYGIYALSLTVAAFQALVARRANR
jgi:hypothetical protein